MRVTISSSLLLTLSTYHTLSTALPFFELRARTPTPKLPDYDVVPVQDPDVVIPGFPSEEDSDDKDVTVTHTVFQQRTQEPETKTVTQQVTSTVVKPSEPETTTVVSVQIVNIQDTAGPAIMTVTVYEDDNEEPTTTSVPIATPTSTPEVGPEPEPASESGAQPSSPETSPCATVTGMSECPSSEASPNYPADSDSNLESTSTTSAVITLSSTTVPLSTGGAGIPTSTYDDGMWHTTSAWNGTIAYRFRRHN